jgi:hypothetical protein
VRVGDLEREVHYTPYPWTLQRIVTVLVTGNQNAVRITSLRYIVSCEYEFGEGYVPSGYIHLQTASPSQPGYILGWQWVTLTGLWGFIGTVVGFAFTTRFTAIATGTIIALNLSRCEGSTCTDLFYGGPSLPVNAGETVVLTATIVTGISGWSIIARSNYTGTISTVIPNTDFLRNISAFFLPLPVASLVTAAPRAYIRSMVIRGQAVTVSVLAGSAQVTYYASVFPSQYLAPTVIFWVGSDTIFVSYPECYIMILANTLAVYLTTPVPLLPGGYHYFTLVITFTE